MEDTPIRVLLIEDDADDVTLIRGLLAEAQAARFQLDHAPSLARGLDRVAAGGADVVLLDLGLPDSRGLQTLTAVQAQAPNMPIVVLTGLNDQAAGLQAVRWGAQDYLIKGAVTPELLARALRYAFERKRTEQEIRALNAELERRVAERTRELAAANAALVKANQELRHIDRMKSAFIEVTSHELRTPVATLGGMLSVIERRLPESRTDLPAALQAARGISRRLDQLVTRIFEIGHMGEFASHLEKQPVAPAELVRQAVLEVTPFVQTRRQTLTVEVEERLPAVSIDAGKIQDVLLNLLMNAIKFTADGGAIRLSVGRPEPARVEFRVADNGIGISDLDKPHLFEEFFSSFDTLHHSSGEFGFGKRGIGLGLAISRKFVEMHHGQIGFESQMGKGATFWFSLPVGGR